MAAAGPWRALREVLNAVRPDAAERFRRYGLNPHTSVPWEAPT